MTICEAGADWRGALKQGGGIFEGAYSFPSCLDDGPGTNPQELLAAAHAGCFFMALTALLEKDGLAPIRIDTTAGDADRPGGGGRHDADADRTFDRWRCTLPRAAGFERYARLAKEGCLVSRALAGVRNITLAAKVISGEVARSAANGQC